MINTVPLHRANVEITFQPAHSGFEPTAPLSARVPMNQTLQYFQPNGESNLHQQLLIAAVNIRLAALRSRLHKCENDCEIATRKAVSKGVPTGRRHRNTDLATRKAKESLRQTKHVLRNASNSETADFKDTANWFLQQLFGDAGLENLRQWLIRTGQAKQIPALEANTGSDDAPLHSMEEVPQAYERLMYAEWSGYW